MHYEIDGLVQDSNNTSALNGVTGVLHLAIEILHDGVIKWKHFPRYWPFVRKRPVARSFDIFFDLRLNNQLNKQSRGWWFETLSCSFRRHCNGQISFISNNELNAIMYINASATISSYGYDDI